jgi:outer membrane receptor protein involved in Fe transport
MNIKLTISLVFLVSFYSFSQEYTVSGSVKDVDNLPMAFCNVTLLELDNRSNIQGTTSHDDGFFEIKGIKPNTYVLNISFLGFKTYQDTLDISRNYNIGNIILQEETQSLDGVTIIAKRPTVKRLVDRVVFDVENSTLSNNNVLEVLKNTPGVLVFDGNITVNKSTPTVYINDRKIHLSSNEIQQLLEGTSASNTKSIEVITNPPARYEAEGGSVINIITSKNIISGYNGSVFGNYKQGSQYPKFSLGTSHFFKTENIDAYLNYNISPRKDFRHNNETINFSENNLITERWETDFKRTRETSNQTINANIDVKINANSTLGLSTNILLSPQTNTKTNVASTTEVYDANYNLDSLFNTANEIVDKRANYAFTLDYTYNFKKVGEKLMISAHHTNYDYLSNQQVDTDYLFPDGITLIRNNKFQTIAGQKIKLYTGQFDYELPIDDNTQFEIGAKYSNIDSESDLEQFNFENDVPIFDDQNSDIFLYDEKNYAAYLSYSKEWDTWSFQLGLRTEYTDILGNSLSTNVINKNDYLKVFPSLYVLHAFNENNELYFNYNKRIYRPRYNELNPFRYYLNDNTYASGNPNLKPQIDDVFTLGYTINGTHTFEAYFRYENDPTLQIVFQDNTENIIKYINTNIDSNISYGLDFTTYTSIAKNWNLYVLSSIFYEENQFFAETINNELVSNDTWAFYGQIVNYFSFLKDKSLTSEVSYLYISPVVNGPANISSRHGLDINLRKTLWNNKGSISVGISDAFNSQNFTQTNDYLNQDYFLKSRLENRLLTVGFTYKFGNRQLKTNQKEIDLEERDRLNSKQD